MELIESKNEYAMKSSLKQIGGALSEKIKEASEEADLRDSLHRVGSGRSGAYIAGRIQGGVWPVTVREHEGRGGGASDVLLTTGRLHL